MAGVIFLKLGNNSKALGFFNQIKSDFPDSTEAKDIDVFIGKAEATIN
jgi:TolA-binding protein